MQSRVLGCPCSSCTLASPSSPLQKHPFSWSFFLVKTQRAPPGDLGAAPCLHPAPYVLCVTMVSAPSRLTHDISLEEFEDEDLSEITDECGISLHCKDSLATRVSACAGGGDEMRFCVVLLSFMLVVSREV